MLNDLDVTVLHSSYNAKYLIFYQYKGSKYMN